MTIKGFILQSEKERYERLVTARAPKVILSNMKKILDSENISVGGDKSLLTTEIVSLETKIGRGGKKYYHINGSINYFPEAVHGKFITKA